MYDRYKFELKPLNYGLNALKPHISSETLSFHHGKHLKAYVDNLNTALLNFPEYQSWPLLRLLYNIECLPKELQTPVKNNGGGVYNHNLYFELLSKRTREPSFELQYAINRVFGSLEEMLEKLKARALEVFGSGYGWLVTDRHGKLSIATTANQDTLVKQNLYPVLVADVWEHAYYLDYQNRRGEYLDNWLKIINWEKASQLYEIRKTLDYSKV